MLMLIYPVLLPLPIMRLKYIALYQYRLHVKVDVSGLRSECYES